MKYIHFIEITMIGMFVAAVALEVLYRLYAKYKYSLVKPQLLTSYPQEYYRSMAEPDCWHYIPLALRVFFPLESSKKVISSNAHGFRTHEFHFIRTAGEADPRVVVILGGSGSWGLGASSDEKVAAHLLENMLNEQRREDGRPWRVYNLSMMAATTQTEILNFLFWGIRLRPAHVISVTGYNDLHVPTAYFDQHHSLFIDPQLKKANEFYTAHSVKSGGFLHECGQFLKGTSQLCNAIIRKFERQQKARTDGSVLEGLEHRLERTVANLELMNDLCRSIGARYTVTFQPVGYGKDALSGPEKENQEYFLRRHPNHKVFEDIKAYQAQRGSIYAEIGEQLTGSGGGIDILDLEHLFDEESSARFTDGITHLNDEGNLALAKAIFAHMTERAEEHPDLMEGIRS